MLSSLGREAVLAPGQRGGQGGPLARRLARPQAGDQHPGVGGGLEQVRHEHGGEDRQTAAGLLVFDVPLVGLRKRAGFLLLPPAPPHRLRGVLDQLVGRRGVQPVDPAQRTHVLGVDGVLAVLYAGYLRGGHGVRRRQSPGDHLQGHAGVDAVSAQHRSELAVA
jgi:hypothetical protein